MTGGNPCYEDLQPRQRQCLIGDTISTVRPVRAGLDRYLHNSISIVTQAACDYANVLIAAGRWRVSWCGRCEKLAEECNCDG